MPAALDRHDVVRGASRLTDLYERAVVCGPDGCSRAAVPVSPARRHGRPRRAERCRPARTGRAVRFRTAYGRAWTRAALRPGVEAAEGTGTVRRRPVAPRPPSYATGSGTGARPPAVRGGRGAGGNAARRERGGVGWQVPERSSGTLRLIRADG
ncbi:hypothetical protein NKH77_11945 [Streptomyces sp. M19]